MLRHAVLLGDPEHFRIKGGNNPYTRDRWGRRKKVDRGRAGRQWNALKAELERRGAVVHVLPAQRKSPGSVFPANAGFLFPKHEALPWGQKRFYLSRLAAHRGGETSAYRPFLEGLGLSTAELPYLFEGEADFFPAGNSYLFTWGPIVRTGFRPAWAFPPYRYRFSHRSDVRNLPALRSITSPSAVLPLRLTDTRFYHGDTAIFAFGRDRDHLLVYPDALDRDSLGLLKARFGGRVTLLSAADAAAFTANSFQLDGPEGPCVFLPSGASSEAQEAVERAGCAAVRVDVSEFFEKGGGSVKCMLCDLGPEPPAAPAKLERTR